MKIAVTHGRTQLHWERDENNVLCINLESMCEDFEESVESFVHAMRPTGRFAMRSSNVGATAVGRCALRAAAQRGHTDRTSAERVRVRADQTDQFGAGTHMIVPVKPPES